MGRPLTGSAALVLLACASSACSFFAVRPDGTAAAPVAPVTGDSADDAIVGSVRAYLHAFKLDEKALPAGLTIPYAAFPPKNPHPWGAAIATGKLGPQGHQVYEVLGLSSQGGGAYSGERFLEIPPEAPPPAPVAPPVVAPPVAPAASPAPPQRIPGGPDATER